jgi:serine/threonine protein kinase
MAAAAPKVPAGFHQCKIPGSDPPEYFVIDKRYTPKGILGKGSYGTVCSAIDQNTKDPKNPKNFMQVAIKKIGKTIFDNLEDTKRIVREIKLLKFLNNENIIGVTDVMGDLDKDFDDIYVVMGMMETDLHKTIYSDNDLTDDHVKYFMWQMLRGLKYMHSANVIHRDMKPANVLLDENCDLKICDFGLARGVASENMDATLTEVVITRWYRAPEVMLAPSEYDYKVDVWSAGCILGELLGRNAMFPGKDYLEQMKLIFEVLGTPHPSDYGFISAHALNYIKSLRPVAKMDWKRKYPKASPLSLDLLDKLLTFNPAKRPTADQAMKHEYFAEYQKQLTDNGLVLPVAPSLVDFTWENQELSKEVLRDLLYEEVLSFRPELRAAFEIRWHGKKAVRKPSGVSAAAAKP